MLGLLLPLVRTYPLSQPWSELLDSRQDDKGQLKLIGCAEKAFRHAPSLAGTDMFGARESSSISVVGPGERGGVGMSWWLQHANKDSGNSTNLWNGFGRTRIMLPSSA